MLLGFWFFFVCVLGLFFFFFRDFIAAVLVALLDTLQYLQEKK